MDPVKKYRLYLVTFCATLASFSVGVYIGWTSPVVPKLREQTEDSPLDYGITTVQEGWIGSLTAVGAFFGALGIGYIAFKFGRKWAILSTSIFYIISYILLIVGNNIWYIYAARTLQGVGGGITHAVVPMYIGEIATNDLRGALGSMLLLSMSCGLVFVYSIGPYVDYMTLQWICLSIPIIQFFLTIFFIPESPYFFAMKNRTKNGIKSLRILRGQREKTTEALMNQIKKEVDTSMLNKGSIVDVFKNRGYRKGLLIGCGCLVFQQLCGTKAVLVNSQSIFSSTNSSLDPAIATIIIGLAQLVSNFPTPFIVERAGRKIVLIISSVGMCLAHLTLGTFFYIQTFGDASQILWLPVPAMIGFNLFFGFGFGPLPWAVMGEMFPSNIKSSATSIACGIYWITSFAVVRWFPELNALGPYYAFWFFGGMCALATLFVLFVVIETKKISLQSIQEKLQA
ncbi:facilitated trehalose transporter Tret1-like [Episyrphus balteatus]|uniref:facilitated trehalose transporter Tret1-like n=1 Tax=Episyrphus balteatus TaxID=286459 RepID=UPI0024851F2E|nr:facilitated trehalose transporter Tret1-like [Episyrphus balteatus]